MSLKEIESVVRRETADALGVEESEIKMESRMVGDLGAESIDFVDLTFRLEKNFDIDIPEGELFESPQNDLNRLTVRDIVDYVATTCLKS